MTANKSTDLKSLKDQLISMLKDNSELVTWFENDGLLSERFSFQENLFGLSGSEKFSHDLENRDEARFFDLLHSGHSEKDLVKYADQSNLIQYYLLHCWAEKYAAKMQLATQWQTVVLEVIQQDICEKNEKFLRNKLELQTSPAKKKLYERMMNHIAKLSSVEQKITYYYQLLEQVDQLHFNHNENKQSIFYYNIDAMVRYEYESMMEWLIERIRLSLPTDPIIQLANTTIKNTQNYFFMLQRMFSMFDQDHGIAFQHRIAALIQTKEMLEGITTCLARETLIRPTTADYKGQGLNTYVLVHNPDKPNQDELWHIDRSDDIPVLTQFPMTQEQGLYLHEMFCSANGDRLFELNDDDEEAQKWRELGKKGWISNPTLLSTQIEFDPESARRIPEFVLSDMSIYRHLLEDRTYFETSNQLTELLKNTEETDENKVLIQCCKNIHEHLELIARDRIGAFPESRGVVPPAQRQKIMEMMMNLVKATDLNKSEKTKEAEAKAKHYFRTHHRIYQGDFTEPPLAIYEDNSFVWDKNTNPNKLYYLREGGIKEEVAMTDSIQLKLKHCTRSADSSEHLISVNDVYHLMTQPGLFYLYRGILPLPQLRWLDFSYYIPFKFDRSKGLHTGTAHEMLQVIHEQKLSVYNLLYRIGEVLVLLAVPMILAAHGIVVPYNEILGVLTASILEWVFLVWNIKFAFEYAYLIFLMNDLVHPELNQLDKMLKDLNEQFERCPVLGENQANQTEGTLDFEQLEAAICQEFPPL